MVHAICYRDLGRERLIPTGRLWTGFHSRGIRGRVGLRSAERGTVWTKLGGGLQVTSVGPAGALVVKKANSQAPPQSLGIRSSGVWGPVTCVLRSPRGDSDACSNVRTTAPRHRSVLPRAHDQPSFVTDITARGPCARQLQKALPAYLSESHNTCEVGAVMFTPILLMHRAVHLPNVTQQLRGRARA